MPRDTLLLVSRATERESIAETHVSRLRRRGVADAVEHATYDGDPVSDLRGDVCDAAGDRLFVVPLSVSHTAETIDAVPAALSYASGAVTYCEPVGRNPAITRAIVQRATDRVGESADASLLLVGFGASGTPYNRQTVEYHAARLREESDYGEVVTSFLLQNPAVECARYNVTNGEAVAVPLFLAPSQATEEAIPSKLELDRGGLAYADVLGEHPLVTDAIEAEVAKQRVLASDEPSAGPQSFEGALTASARPMATDGDGRPL